MPAPKDHRDQGPAADRIGRRLVIRPGAIGDCIVSLPAIEFLQPSEIWAPTQNLPLLRHLAPVRSISSTGLDLLEIEGQDKATRDLLAGFDEIVSWYGASREEFHDAVRDLPFRFLAALPREGSLHAANFYLNQVGAPLGRAPRLPWRWQPERFAVIHPFSGSARKNWPRERFQAFAAALPIPVEWCAGPAEALDGAQRFDTLDALAAWVARASLYAGNDSGITHLAAECGVPTLAIFNGTSDPAVWSPRGDSVIALENPSVEDAIKAGSQLLAR